LSATTLLGQEQEPSKHRREGFWFQGGLGVGGFSLNCDPLGLVECPEGSERAGITKIALGGRLTPLVHLGGSVDVWASSGDGVAVWYGATSLLVMIYPSASSGFWINFGPGFSFYSEEQAGATWEVESASLVGGLGYDIRVGSMLSLTPFFDFLLSMPADIKLNGAAVPDSHATPRMFGLGLAITVH